MEDIGNETGFTFMPHPMFHVVEGSIESWEKINHSEMQKVNGWKDGNY
jgi:hypothetical protein